ncbi:MAG: DUF2796 domain-containing protein [Gammaproteobacteria bacterium]
MNITLKTLLLAGAVIACSGCGESHPDDAHEDELSPASASVEANGTDDHESDDHNDDHDDDHPEDAQHDDHADDERRQVGAHLHGDAKLAVALEGKTLFIELDTPVYNLTGFEHAPRNEEEETTARDVEALLAQPMRLFSINEQAGCKAREQSTSQSRLPFELHAQDEHADDDHHDEHAESTDTHRDVVVEYAFDCQSPDRIERLAVSVFEFFPRIEELDTVILDQNSQRTMALTPDNHDIDFPR